MNENVFVRSTGSNDLEKQKQKPNVRKEEEEQVMPILDSDGIESTTDSISLNYDFTTTWSPPLPVEVSSYKLRGQPNVDVPNKESVALDPIEDGTSSIDDPVANQSGKQGVDGKESSPGNVHNDDVIGKVPIASTIGPVLGYSAINSELEDAVEKREDDHLQVVTDALQLYTLSPDQEKDKKIDDSLTTTATAGKVIDSSSLPSSYSSSSHGKDGESLEIKSTTTTTTTSPTFVNSNNGTSTLKAVTEVITSPPNTHLDSIQQSHSAVLESLLFSPSSTQKSNLTNPSSPSPSSPITTTTTTTSSTTTTGSPLPPPTSLPELEEVKIQPNVLYSSWKSGSSASSPTSNEVNEDRDRVEIILDGIIHALDQRLNEELPSEPRVEDKNKKVSDETDKDVDKVRKEVSQKTVTSRKEDTLSFELPPLLPTGFITNLDQSYKDTQHKDNPSSSHNSPTIPSSLLNSAFGKIVHVSSMIGFASDSPRKPEVGGRKPDTHSVKPGSASFMVVDDPSSLDQYKKGSVFDGDSGGVEIITAKTPFLEAENISDSDSFLVNLSPTTLKVGSSSPYLYSPGSSSSDLNQTPYESLSPWTSNNRAPIKPMASFPTYYGSSTNQWKIVSQNHGPTGKSPKAESDSLYYSDQLSKRTGQLSPTSEALAVDSDKRASRLDDSMESSFHSPDSEYRMKVLSFASNDGLGHQSNLQYTDSASINHQNFRRLNGSSFARVRVPIMTGNANANHPYQIHSQSSKFKK